MIRRHSSTNSPSLSLLGLFISLFFAPCVARGQSSSDDLLKALFQAEKNLRENRKDDVLEKLKKLMDLVGNYKASDKDYIREAYWWIFDQKTPDKAFAPIQKAIDMNEKAAEAYYLRGYLNKTNTRVPVRDVVADFRKALDRKKEYGPGVGKDWDFYAAREMWSLLSDPSVQNYKLAAQQFGELAGADPKNSHFLFYLGLANYRLDKYRQAAEALVKGVLVKPADWETHSYCVLALKVEQALATPPRPFVTKSG